MSKFDEILHVVNKEGNLSWNGRTSTWGESVVASSEYWFITDTFTGESILSGKDPLPADFRERCYLKNYDESLIYGWPREITAEVCKKLEVVDSVNHPPHYLAHPSGVECITITEHFNFCLGNAIKYIWRAGEKSSGTKLEDLKKARWYLDREIAREEGKK